MSIPSRIATNTILARTPIFFFGLATRTQLYVALLWALSTSTISATINSSLKLCVMVVLSSLLLFCLNLCSCSKADLACLFSALAVCSSPRNWIISSTKARNRESYLFSRKLHQKLFLRLPQEEAWVPLLSSVSYSCSQSLHFLSSHSPSFNSKEHSSSAFDGLRMGRMISHKFCLKWEVILGSFLSLSVKQIIWSHILN